MPEGPLFAANDDDYGPAGDGGDYAYGDDSDDDAGDENGGEGEDQGDGEDEEESAADAAAFSKSEFANGDSSSVVHCQPRKKKAAKKKAKKKICPVATIKKNLDTCDGGTNAWANAKKAAGKEPTVKLGKTSSKFEAETSGSEITIRPTSNCCDATESLLFELHNVEDQKRFDKIDSDAANGVYSREDYTRAEERVEYDGLKRSWETFDKCKKTWGCGAGAKSFAAGFKKAKSFDDYYKHYLVNSHKNVYRGYWDRDYKKPYDAKHKKGP